MPGVSRLFGKGNSVTLYRRVRRYGAPAIALHWLVALGIFVLFIHGATMMLIPEEHRLAALNVHRSIGIVVFALVLFRIAWRLTHRPPTLRMRPRDEAIAHFVHNLIYALLVANGLAGAIGWLASGDPITFFGWELRPAHDPQRQVARICLAIGFATARAMLFVIALHVLAALKHHVLDRDRLLERMWPGRTIEVTLHSVLAPLTRDARARPARSGAKRRRRRHRSRRPATWTTKAATY
jgi:cytochrome b561